VIEEVDAIELNSTPVGIKMIPRSNRELEDRDLLHYRGPSFCDAISRASRGEALLVTAGSIEKCLWAPAVLGLQEPESAFERSLSPRFKLVKACMVAPVSFFDEAGCSPDVVIIREKQRVVEKIFNQLETGALALNYLSQTDKSALALIAGNRSGVRKLSITGFNRLVEKLKKRRQLKRIGEYFLRKPFICYLFDKLISLLLADMSVCRNSTVIPALTGRANCSYFCSGAVFWGENSPDNFTAGIPYPVFCKLKEKLNIIWLAEKNF